MPLAERREVYKAIEVYRKRPLIVLATSTRHNVNALLASDIVRELIDQIDAITNGDSIDVLLHSTGGDALAAWKLMSILRERFKKIGVLVPFMAFSAATIFALGADEIVMHPHASLGPIDPQITVTNNGQTRQFAYEDVGAFLRFLRDEVEVSEQQHTTALVEKLFAAVDPIHIGSAKRASELASQIGERLLKLHMSEEDKAKAQEIAKDLNKSFFAHGDAVSRTRAKELHLKVAESDPALEALLWQAYEKIEEYMEIRKPFIFIDHCLADANAAAALVPTAGPSIPSNAPPQVVQAIWQNAIQIAAQTPKQPVEVPYRLVGAISESIRTASCFAVSGALMPVRGANNEILITRIDKKVGWEPVSA
jgi:hypothetical protein